MTIRERQIRRCWFLIGIFAGVGIELVILAVALWR